MALKTVYSHRRNIASKLGIKSGREMVRYAVHWARSAE
jgi:DNA-binding CsgD family transcriptional regulator